MQRYYKTGKWATTEQKNLHKKAVEQNKTMLVSELFRTFAAIISTCF